MESPGGLLVGKSDKNGGEGINVIAPEGAIKMGGGEIVINENSSKKHCETLSVINQEGGGVAIPCGVEGNFSRIMESGGKVDPAKELARQMIEGLTDDQLSEIKKEMLEAVSAKIVETQNVLDQIIKEKKALIQKKKDHDEAKNYHEAFAIRNEIFILDLKIRNLNNILLAIKNGGDTVSFTDKKGFEHNNIPSFIQVNTDFISFDEDSILTDPLPAYIPIIDEEIFARKGYLFDAIRIGTDTYILSTAGYKEYVPQNFSNKTAYFGSDDNRDIAEDFWQGYVLVTLDQLALISDYYYMKAKATEQKRANESNKKTEDYYDKLSLEKRQGYYNQKGFYNSLPVKVKKKFTEEVWSTLTLEEKESHYKPIQKKQGKRLVSKLEDDSMWVSFHEMYERFLNPEARPIKKNSKQPVSAGERYSGHEVYANAIVFAYWDKFRYMMSWKIKDIAVQRQFESELRSIALETSFGESNTNDLLKEKYGILVKRQNGDKIKPNEIEQIRNAWTNINKLFGGLVNSAKDSNLKISHTGNRLVFASKAAGMYIPKMKTIAVSAKFGESQFENIMAHETAHWIDNILGTATSHRYISDDFECSAGILADTLRRKMNSKSDSNYINSTKECFARALEQYFAIQTYGDDASIVMDHNALDTKRPYFYEDHYVNKEVYEKELKPLVEAFISENKDFFKYSIVPDQEEPVKTTDIIPGGLSKGIPDSDFDPIELEKGMKVELEHTTDPKIAKEIAKDHLTEDKDYYKKLAVMEGKSGSPKTETDMKTKINTRKINNIEFASLKKGDPVAFKDTSGAFTLTSYITEIVPPNPEIGEPLETYIIAAGGRYTADELRKIDDPLIGKFVHLKNVPTSKGIVSFKDKEGYFVKFNNGTDGSFSAEDLIIDEPLVLPAQLREKTVEEYKKDLTEIIDEEVKKYETQKSKSILDEISKTLSIYWENIVSKHPEELPSFLEVQKNIPSRVKVMASYGATQEYSDAFRGNLKTNLWNLIPEEYKKYKLPKKISYSPNPEDKNLANLMKGFKGYDDLRPIMTGVHFDSAGIVATNAHILLFLSHPEVGRPEATYCMTNDCLKVNDGNQELTQQYPKYKQVIPENRTIVSIHAESLIAYLRTVIAIKYFHISTRNILMTFGSGNDLVEFGFNANFLLEAAESMYSLGYEEIDMGYSTPNRAVILCPKGRNNDVQKLMTDFALVMPVMIGDYLSFDSGSMYFDAESECVSTKGIDDKSCLNPVKVAYKKNEQTLSEVKAIHAEIINHKKESEEKEIKQKSAKKIANDLMRIAGQVENILKIRSGSQLYEDHDLQRHYGLAMDKAVGEYLAGKESPLSPEIEDIIEDNNYHTLNQYLTLSGAYGEDKKKDWIGFLKKPTTNPEYFLRPDIYLPPAAAIEFNESDNLEILASIDRITELLPMLKGKERKEAQASIHRLKEMTAPEKKTEDGRIEELKGEITRLKDQHDNIFIKDGNKQSSGTRAINKKIKALQKELDKALKK